MRFVVASRVVVGPPNGGVVGKARCLITNFESVKTKYALVAHVPGNIFHGTQIRDQEISERL